jgi:nucleotide-binding universal stress UspA family protein
MQDYLSSLTSSSRRQEFVTSPSYRSPKQRGAWETELFQAVLLGSGRPVLVVPYIQRGEARLDNVLIAWDGSKEAARAVHDALPLLQRAKMVEVLTVATEAHGGAEVITGADLARHLVGHGLPATARSMSVDIDVSDALLSHAADAGVNMIVMGGYAHSRLRDLVFGGATIGILNSMTVPVLMSH